MELSVALATVLREEEEVAAEDLAAEAERQTLQDEFDESSG